MIDERVGKENINYLQNILTYSKHIPPAPPMVFNFLLNMLLFPGSLLSLSSPTPHNTCLLIKTKNKNK